MMEDPRREDTPDPEDSEEEDWFQYHDGGTRFLDNGFVRMDCECGWQGTPTKDLDAAWAERRAHEQEMGDE